MKKMNREYLDSIERNDADQVIVDLDELEILFRIETYSTEER